MKTEEGPGENIYPAKDYYIMAMEADLMNENNKLREQLKDMQAYADQQVNRVLEELTRRLDAGYKDYVWYKHLRKEVESLKIKQP